MVKFSTEYPFLSGKIEYEFDGKPVVFENAGWLNSESVLPFSYEKIPPGESYAFSLSFELEPDSSFTTENYLQNFWSIIPTLEVTITQDEPQPLVLTSEPITWQNLSICNEPVQTLD